jgi:hypothetical protein
MNERFGLMKTMTIHGIDPQLDNLIKSKAKAEGLSVNKTIKKLLEISLGITPRPGKKNISDFEEFCGVWTREDVKEFEKTIEDLSQVAPGDWQ